MKLAICRLPLPQSPLTSFSFMQKQMKAPCFQTSRILQRASLTAHVFFTTAMALQGAKGAHCIWRLSTLTNHQWTGNHQSAGSYQSRLIGRCATTTWKWPLCAGGLVPTGAITAPKWRGAAQKELTHMSALLQFSTAWAMSYPRLSALKSSCN